MQNKTKIYVTGNLTRIMSNFYYFEVTKICHTDFLYFRVKTITNPYYCLHVINRLSMTSMSNRWVINW